MSSADVWGEGSFQTALHRGGRWVLLVEATVTLERKLSSFYDTSAQHRGETRALWYIVSVASHPLSLRSRSSSPGIQLEIYIEMLTYIYQLCNIYDKHMYLETLS